MIKKDLKSKRATMLKAKWGRESTSLNEMLEKGSRENLALVQERWEVLTDEAKQYFRELQSWHQAWDNGVESQRLVGATLYYKKKEY